MSIVIFGVEFIRWWYKLLSKVWNPDRGWLFKNLTWMSDHIKINGDIHVKFWNSQPLSSLQTLLSKPPPNNLDFYPTKANNLNNKTNNCSESNLLVYSFDSLSFITLELLLEMVFLLTRYFLIQYLSTV